MPYIFDASRLRIPMWVYEFQQGSITLMETVVTNPHVGL